MADTTTHTYGTGGIRATFSPVAGPVNHYEVELHHCGDVDGVVQRANTVTTGSETLFTGLDAGYWYTARTRAVNANGAGGWSSFSWCDPAEALLAAPQIIGYPGGTAEYTGDDGDYLWNYYRVGFFTTLTAAISGYEINHGPCAAVDFELHSTECPVSYTYTIPVSDNNSNAFDGGGVVYLGAKVPYTPASFTGILCVRVRAIAANPALSSPWSEQVCGYAG
ncbi:MAG: fibronectin type III domain-containing protein [Proteobacteria bacterium]|nr:fibronectin type III domain-containing protein [Pseudomonadota bacterium]